MPASASSDTARAVVLILVPNLTWSTAPQALDQFAKANLSMRSAQATSEPADTYLTIGKGARSARPSAGTDVGRVERVPDGSLRLLDWPVLERHDRSLHYGGRLGTVGEALQSAGRRWGLVSDDADTAAAAAAASVGGMVPAAYPAAPDGLERALRAQLDVIFVVTPTATLAQLLTRLTQSCTLVASASTPSGSRHLGVLAASPPCGLGQGGLASASTHHAHLATLPDVSATLLTLAGADVPSSVAGAAVTPSPTIDRDALVRRDRRTWAADRSRTGFVWLFVLLHLAGAGAVVRWPRSRAVVCSTLLAIPAASLLMMLVPWWKGGAWAGLVAGGAFSLVIAWLGALVVKRHAVLGVGLLAAAVSAVVAVDALFGSPLEIDAPFGNSPVVAGRFFGVGNIGSGFLVAGLLVASALAIDRRGRRAVPWVAAGLAVGVVAGSAPQFGADVGGALYAVPAYGLLLVGSVRQRVKWRDVLVVAIAAVIAVGLFALADLARAPAAQTHLAKGVGGDRLGDEIVRKATRAIATIKAPMAGIVPIAAAAFVLSRWSPGLRRTAGVAGTALVAAAVLGSCINDSGFMVAGAIAAVAWPAAMLVSEEARERRRSGAAA